MATARQAAACPPIPAAPREMGDRPASLPRSRGPWDPGHPDAHLTERLWARATKPRSRSSFMVTADS